MDDFGDHHRLLGCRKSTALNVFEDAGYFSVDNLPPRLIEGLVELFSHEGSKVERAAIVSDVRGGEYFEAMGGVLDMLDRGGMRHRVLFLDADEQTLRNRYQETRRRHPLAASVGEGIAAERELLRPLERRADVVIDTSALSTNGLREAIVERLLGPERATQLSVTFASFGFSMVRCATRTCSSTCAFSPIHTTTRSCVRSPATDPRVVAFIDSDGRLRQLYDLIEPLLDFLLPQYVAEGKSHLLVAIGCTGGRHRSVAVVEHLARRYASEVDMLVQASHRDVGKQAADG